MVFSFSVALLGYIFP